MSFEVFLRIGYFVDNVETFRALRGVCHQAKRACEHLKTLKQYQFTMLYLEYDGWNSWSIHNASDLANGKELNLPWPITRDANNYGVLAVCRGNTLNRACGFLMKRQDILKNICNQCDDRDHCDMEFKNK